jgi:DNA-directed RNA polymerase subunit RPC12/RpoP
MNNYTTVLTFTYPYEVAIVRGRLESEGIECFVQDELTVQVNPFYSNAIGGVKLQVKNSDLKQAVEILEETGYIKKEDLQPSKDKIILNKILSEIPINKEIMMQCPLCGSDEVVEVKKAGWLFLFFSLLFQFPVPFFSKRYHCFDCGHEFKHKNEEKISNS